MLLLNGLDHNPLIHQRNYCAKKKEKEFSADFITGMAKCSGAYTGQGAGKGRGGRLAHWEPVHRLTYTSREIAWLVCGISTH